MKANSLDLNENRPLKGKPAEATICNIEELEDVIAPAIASNHNETLVSGSE